MLNGQYNSIKYKIDYPLAKFKENYASNHNNTISLYITNYCNLNCLYCYDRFRSSNLKQSPNQYMDISYIKKIVENNPSIEKYDILGGEPLMHRDINEIISYISGAGKNIDLITNGYYLDMLKITHRNLRICVSFMAIDSPLVDEKPIAKIIDQLQYFERFYPMKITFLLTNNNQDKLFTMAEYLEKNLKKLDTLTIGLIRNESDYWNDNYQCILPFRCYYERVQEFIKFYDGRLNIDIYSKGVLYTDKLQESQNMRGCRSKCIFTEFQCADCPYLIDLGKMQTFDADFPVEFLQSKTCDKTILSRCLLDKVKLKKSPR